MQQWVQHFGQTPSEDSCVCRADFYDAKRHCNNPHHIPRWLQRAPPRDDIQCAHKDCNEGSKLILAGFMAKNALCAILDIPVPNKGPFLCCKHYHEVYKCSKECASCKARPKTGQQFNRHSPDPHQVNICIQSNDLPLSPITHDDIICLNCYKLHLSVVDKDVISTTNKLLKLSNLSDTSTMGNADRAIAITCKTLAQYFLNQQAVLLPSLGNVFLQCYFKDSDVTCNDNPTIELEDSIVHFTNKWLLQQLITKFGTSLSYKCVHPKFGTMLFRRDGDQLTSLSWALGTSSSTLPEITNHLHTEPSDSVILKKAGAIINTLIHEEIDKLASNKEEPKEFKLSTCIAQTNPMLVDFVKKATQSSRELNKNLGIKDKVAKHTKTVRQFFIICLMLFCTNPTCQIPIHILLTDTVAVCGGTRKLKFSTGWVLYHQMIPMTDLQQKRQLK